MFEANIPLFSIDNKCSAFEALSISRCNFTSNYIFSDLSDCPPNLKGFAFGIDDSGQRKFTIDMIKTSLDSLFFSVGNVGIPPAHILATFSSNGVSRYYHGSVENNATIEEFTKDEHKPIISNPDQKLETFRTSCYI